MSEESLGHDSIEVASGHRRVIDVSRWLYPTTIIAVVYLSLALLGMIGSLLFAIVFPMAIAATVILTTVAACVFVAGYLLSRRSLYGYLLWIAEMAIVARICWGIGKKQTVTSHGFDVNGQRVLYTFVEQGSATLRDVAYVHLALGAFALVECLVLIVVRLRRRHARSRWLLVSALDENGAAS